MAGSSLAVRDDGSSLIALVLVVDARHVLKDLDLAVLSNSSAPAVGAVLATKADKLTTTAQRKRRAHRHADPDGISTGAPHVVTQLFSGRHAEGVPEAEPRLIMVPSSAWQNETSDDRQKRGPRSRGVTRGL